MYVAQLVKCLSSMYEALDLLPRTVQQNVWLLTTEQEDQKFIDSVRPVLAT